LYEGFNNPHTRSMPAQAYGSLKAFVTYQFSVRSTTGCGNLAAER